MLEENEKLKEEIRAEFLATRKRNESVWRQARGRLREKTKVALGTEECNKFIDIVAAIGRVVFNQCSSSGFTEIQIEILEEMLDEFLAITVKYMQRCEQNIITERPESTNVVHIFKNR